MIDASKSRQIFRGGSLWLWLVLILIGNTPSWCQSAETLYADALRALQRSDYRQGVKLYYRALLISDPILSVPCRKQDLQQAWKYFTELQKRDGPSPKVFFHLSIIRRVCEEFEKAEILLKPLRRQYPQDPFLAFLEGEILLALDRPQAAAAIFKELEARPQAKDLFDLAKNLQRRGDHDSLSDAGYQQKLTTGNRLLALMEYAPAEALFQELRRLRPDDPEAVRSLMSLYLETSRVSEAVAVLDAFRGGNPPQKLPPLFVGRVLYQAGRFAEVIPVLTPVIQDDPEHEYALQLLAESCFQAHRLEEAADYFTHLLPTNLENPGFHLRLAICREETGKVQEADQTFQDAMKAIPDQWIRFEYAEFLARQQRFTEAIERYTEVSGTPGPFRKEAEERAHTLRMALLDSAGDNPATASATTVSPISTAIAATEQPSDTLRAMRRAELLQKVADMK